MKNCCGEERKTPYCPICGKSTGTQHNLTTLLSFIEAHVNRCQGEVNNAEEEPYANKALQEHRLKMRKRTLGKWLNWREAVTKAIQRQEQGESP